MSICEKQRLTLVRKQVRIFMISRTSFRESGYKEADPWKNLLELNLHLTSAIRRE